MDTLGIEDQNSLNVTSLTAEIVAAYVSNNSVRPEDLAALIGTVHSALRGMPNGKAEAAPEPQEPAVPVRKSISPDHIVCLEDGKRFKSLKRHLRTDHNLTPQDYRAKWGLKADYPMVAPNYAQARSELARTISLGRKARGAEAAAPVEQQAAAVKNSQLPKPAKRARRPKAAAQSES